jgi:hypothetical protein
MKWVFRPLVLVTVSILLVGTAALVSLPRKSLAQPTAEPVAAGDVELAWLYPATSGSSWELLVQGVQRVGRSKKLVVDAQRAFPPQTTAVPEVILTLPDSTRSPGPRRLVFRWYKLTGSWREKGWVKALLERNPPPLAIIGGSNSEGARDLAVELEHEAIERWGQDRSRSPLLFLTYATADKVKQEGKQQRNFPAGKSEDRVKLQELYSERTFRFCFTNEQMAKAATRFVWSRDELRPDVDQLYSVQWLDDDYSIDLATGFTAECEKANQYWLRVSVLRESVGALGFAAGRVLPAYPLVAPALADLRGWQRPDLEQLRLEAGGDQGANEPIRLLPTPERVDSSVGPFTTANIFETRVAQNLLDSLLQKQALGGSNRLPSPLGGEVERSPFVSRRPLLMVTGQVQPTRRLLRELARSAPHTARRCVVATDDVLTFNTIYRDRHVAWPVQEMPFSLVFFCHYNPIDRALDFPDLDKTSRPALEDGSLSGTDDRLLPIEIVETLLQVWSPAGENISGPAVGCGPEEVAGRLKELHWSPPLHQGEVPPSRRKLFQPDGQRRGGTGEHIVYLQPRFQGDQILGEADVEVWSWEGFEDQPDPQRMRTWKQVGRLEVSWKDPLGSGQP